MYLVLGCIQHRFDDLDVDDMWAVCSGAALCCGSACCSAVFCSVPWPAHSWRCLSCFQFGSVIGCSRRHNGSELFPGQSCNCWIEFVLHWVCISHCKKPQNKQSIWKAQTFIFGPSKMICNFVAVAHVSHWRALSDLPFCLLNVAASPIDLLWRTSIICFTWLKGQHHDPLIHLKWQKNNAPRRPWASVQRHNHALVCVR